MEDKVFIKNKKTGLKIAAVWDLPAEKTNKAVILAHGLTVDKDEDGVFVQLSNLLKENGYAVIRFDFNGHGESEGESVDFTIKKEVQDVETIVDYVRQQGYEEIGLVGASFGGGVAALYASANQSKLKCLSLWNPCLDYDHCLLHPFLPWIVNDIGRIRDDLKTQGWTTLGSRKFKIGKQLFEEMEHLFPFQELKKITIPTSIIHGDKDTYVPYEDSKEYVRNLIKGEFISIEGAGHGFHEPNETTRAIEETLKFFKKYL